MMLDLPLSPELEARLRERAAASGQDPAAFVLEAVRQKLAASSGDGQGSPSELSLDEWLGRFDAWVRSHPPLGFEVDDSREGIYAGRGE